MDIRDSMGTIHPISQVWEEVTAIFADMGFSVAEGPQIETSLLYTSDSAGDSHCVDLWRSRSLYKKKNENSQWRGSSTQ